MTDKIKQLKDIIYNSNKIVFFGGAGVSTESGIPDFRSQDGLYNQKYKYPPEYMLSHGCLFGRPKEFWEFYRDKMLVEGAKPNDAHKVLAELEKQGKLLGIITQNIDNLHETAGSKEVYHIHGTIMTNHCTRCGTEYDIDYIRNTTGVPKCICSGMIRPDVTLYDESLPHKEWDASERILYEAEVLIVAGTSLQVYPANTLLNSFRGKRLIVINREELDNIAGDHLYIQGNIGEVLKQII